MRGVTEDSMAAIESERGHHGVEEEMPKGTMTACSSGWLQRT